MHEETDILVKACQQNDRQAQGKIYKRFSPKMYAVCLRYCKNEVDAQDSLQEARFQLLRIDPIIPNVKDAWYLMNYRMIRAYVSDLNADFDDAIEQNQLGLDKALTEMDTAYQSRFHNNLGLAYNGIREYQSAIVQLKKAAFLFGLLGERQNEASAWTNVGSTYSSMEMYDSALVYLQKAKVIFDETDSRYELAAYFGNVAHIAYLRGNYQESIRLLHQKLAHLASANEQTNRPVILLQLRGYVDLGESFLAVENLDSASFYFKMVYGQAESQQLFDQLVKSAEGLSKVYEKRNKPDSVLHYYRAYASFKDSLANRENRQQAMQLKADFELKQALAREQKKQELLMAEKDRELLTYVIIILSLIALIFAIYAAYQRTRKKQREEELMALQLQAEKRKLERDLAIKEKELTAKQVKLSETETRIEDTLKELKEVLVDKEHNPANRLRELAKKMEGRSSRKAIDSLDSYLQESDNRLFEALSLAHPELTRSELRLCAFIRLNLSLKEIAGITHQNVNSLKMARYRLRKKLGLEANKNLVSYLNNLVSENT